jgi:hypothetical protein
VLRTCVRGTTELKSEVARTGWTPELIARALAMIRVAGAAATGQPITQAQADTQKQEREGQVLVRNGMFRSTRSLISAPTTAATLDEQLAHGNGVRSDPATQALVGEIRDSLRVLNAARYGRNGHINPAALDDALERAVGAIQRLHARAQWPARAVERLRQAADRVRDTVWSR